MPNFSVSVFLQAFADTVSTNAPKQSYFKWQSDRIGLTGNNPISQSFSLAPNETRQIFSGTRALSQDNTTQYNLALKSNTSNTYVLSWVGGTNPVFRTSRTTGADATTQVTISINGPVATFTSTAGTAYNLSSVQVGDYVNIGSNFNVLNQGLFQIISTTTTSFSIENTGAVAEVVTLGAGYALQTEIFSAAGVQLGDTLRIFGGFSPASYGSYELTGVYSNRIEFYSNNALPTQTVTTQSLAVYFENKQLVYLESDQLADLNINGVDGGTVEPYVTLNGNQPGQFLRKATIWSMSVTNNSLNTANVYFAALE